MQVHWWSKATISYSDYASRLLLMCLKGVVDMYDDSVILHSVLTSCSGISSQASSLFSSSGVKFVWKLVVHLSRWAMKESIQSTSICAEVSTFLVAFRKPFPVPGWIEPKNSKKLCHATQSRHVQDGVEVNENLWSSPLELVTVNVPSSSLIICTSPWVYLRDFDRLSKQWMMTDRGYHEGIRVQ